MAYIKKDGFDFLCDINGNAEYFVLKGISLNEELEYIKRNQVISIYLTYSDSKAVKNLDFLKEINFIEKINLNELEIDYSGLYALKNLKYAILSVKSKKQHLDYARFKNLEYLSVDWYEPFPNLQNNTNLKCLVIWKFRPKSKSFINLELPEFLNSLEITESNITDLSGLSLTNLKKFEAHYCNSIQSLSGLENFGSNLEIIILDHCKKVDNFKAILSCSKLRKLILGNCGKIDSIAWIRTLLDLQFFSFYNTEVEDGDVSVCIGLDYVSFKNKKHYSHTIEKIRELNNQQKGC